MSLLEQHLMIETNALESIDFLMEDLSVAWNGKFTIEFIGLLFVNWGDGSAKESLTSNIQQTHLYSPGSYIAKITKDLESITQIDFANSRTKSVTNLKTGTLTKLKANNNKLTTLDLSNAPLSGIFNVGSNPDLQVVIFASSGNGLLNTFDASDCDLLSLDLTNITIGAIFSVRNNVNLASLIFASSGNGLGTSVQIFNTALASIDFKDYGVSGFVQIYDNPNLTSIIFASSNGQTTNFRLDNCNLSSLNLSNVPIKTTFRCDNNSNLNSITFSSTGNGFLSNFNVSSCNLSSLDLSNLSFGGAVSLNNNILTNVVFAAAGHGNVATLDLSNNALTSINFEVFGVDFTGCSRNFANNGFDAAYVNYVLVTIDGISSGGIGNRTLTIDGTNAAPDSSSGGNDGTAAKANLISKGWVVTTN